MTDTTKQAPTEEEIRNVAIERAAAVMAAHFSDLVQTSHLFSNTFRGATNEQRWLVPVPVSLPVFTSLCALAGEHPSVQIALDKQAAAAKAAADAARAAMPAANETVQ